MNRVLLWCRVGTDKYLSLVLELLKSASFFPRYWFYWYSFAFIVLPSLRMAEYVVPSENYPLPRLTYFKEALAQKLSHHSSC